MKIYMGYGVQAPGLPPASLLFLFLFLFLFFFLQATDRAILFPLITISDVHDGYGLFVLAVKIFDSRSHSGFRFFL